MSLSNGKVKFTSQNPSSVDELLINNTKDSRETRNGYFFCRFLCEIQVHWLQPSKQKVIEASVSEKPKQQGWAFLLSISS